MSRKKNLNFILKESAEERLVFRFYPKCSHCHSFYDTPPKNWSEVYKVYYSYAILKQWKNRENDPWNTEIVFKEPCDECSIIDEVAARCLLLSEEKETFTKENGTQIPLLDNEIRPFGMGTSWTIKKIVHTDFRNENIQHVRYIFTLFDYFGTGYRFSLKAENIKAFGEYLRECCEYMLAHGEGI